jgi:Zn-dependent protease/predicted transcriptional regulator
VAQRYRIPIGQITLFLFGGVAHMAKEPPSPKAEFLIAIAGPIVSFAIGIGCLGMTIAAETVLDQSGTRGFIVLGGLLGIVNLNLGLFNLIPGFPLDGGRMLRAGLWAWSGNFHRATSHAAVIGLVFGAAFGAGGAMLLAASVLGVMGRAAGGNGGWLMFIGAFLFSAAWNARRQVALRMALDSTMARDVMVRSVVMIPPDLSLQSAVDEYFVVHGFGGFPVAEEGEVIGLITVEDVRAVSPSLWVWRTVRAVMRPASPGLFVPSDSSIRQALDRMVQEEWDRLVVLEGGKVVGLVTRSAIAQFLRLQKV